MVAGSSPSTVDFDLSLMETDTPKLSHLCKNRPKPRKTHSTLKPNAGVLPLTSALQPDVSFVAFFNKNATPDSTSTGCSGVNPTVVTRSVLSDFIFALHSLLVCLVL
jgi:hypothetical protein